MLKKGDIIGGMYEIHDEIGKGGVGIIYLGYHMRLKKKVVIKKIKDNFVGKINERGEADLLKNLHHSFLPQVYDFLQIENQVFTVMDYIEGNSMEVFLKRKDRFSEKLVVMWLKQLCEVLSYLHHQEIPIIHSDIKPSNIMVRPNGSICLIDFNISFGEDELKGISGYTQRYAAPEQLLKHQLYKNNKIEYRTIPIDGRSDIYSLGVTMYHMITGILPPDNYRMIKPLDQLETGYSDNLISIIKKAMEPSVAYRYQSIDQMKDALVNIKKNDAEYKRIVFLQRLVSALGVGFLVAGIAAGYLGYQTVMTEAFTEEYEALIEISETDDYLTVISEGIDLLNNGKYQNAMKKETAKKADIFYMIANSYFEQDSYSNAITYYEEAVKYNKQNPEYFRDYAIAQARQKNLEQAKSILEQAISLHLEEDHICLVKAEIALAENQGQEAIAWFEKALSMTENEYLRSRAYILCGRAYRQLGDYQGEIRILEEARGRVESDMIPVITRALAAAYMRHVNQMPAGNERTEYIRKAADCYLTLTNGIQSNFSDQMNLAICYEMQGEYGKEQEVLNTMQSMYPNDYKVYMRQALMHLSVEAGKPEQSRNYANVKMYYDLAEQYYQSVRNSGATDHNMQYLEQKVIELKQKGWLS